MFFIYVLYSKIGDKYYVGYTTDWRKRLLEHNSQDFYNTYTSKFRPWELAAVFACGTDLSTAMKLERFIKKQHSRKPIEKLCDQDFVPGGYLAQLIRVRTSGINQRVSGSSASRLSGVQKGEPKK